MTLALLGSIRISDRLSVVLPQPLSPINASASPLCRSKETPVVACTSPRGRVVDNRNIFDF